MMHAVSSLDVAQIEAVPAEERIRLAYQHYGERLVLSTSFGVQSAVMLHMVTQIVPQIPILFIDTGYLFPETYRFAAELSQRLTLNLKTFRSQQSAAQQEALYGKLWEQGLDGLKKYNELNKVEPMNRAITQLSAQAWLSGLRRVQSNSREKRPAIEQQNKIVKLYPIIDWSDKAIYDYLTQHDLPYHPLWDQGYVSVGDWHSTSKLSTGMRAEDTRFGGLKRECGLHESSEGDNYQI
jgi:phosphoadenosine phosphosulfate reductase